MTILERKIERAIQLWQQWNKGFSAHDFADIEASDKEEYMAIFDALTQYINNPSMTLC